MESQAGYLSRKFILSLASLIGLFVLVWFRKHFGGEFVTALLGVLAFYSGSNVYSEFLAHKRGASPAKKAEGGKAK